MSKKEKKQKKTDNSEKMDLREYKQLTASCRKIATYGEVDIFKTESGFVGLTRPEKENDPTIVVKDDELHVVTVKAAQYDQERA